MLFVGTDVGGTFTDVVIFDEESRKSPEVIKAPTDLKRPELAIVKALGKYQGRTEQFALVSHATTIATNSLLTQSGLAATALITNEGFRDVLEIGRQRRPEIYNLNKERPKQLVHFFFQAEDGIRDLTVTGVQTCALPICDRRAQRAPRGTLAHQGRAARGAFARPAGAGVVRVGRAAG